jgi:ABC-type molybdate transport system substrate-binding protein
MVILPVNAAAETVCLYAAGSLKAALADIKREFDANSGGSMKVETVLAPIRGSSAQLVNINLSLHRMVQRRAFCG